MPLKIYTTFKNLKKEGTIHSVKHQNLIGTLDFQRGALQLFKDKIFIAVSSAWVTLNNESV